MKLTFTLGVLGSCSLIAAEAKVEPTSISTNDLCTSLDKLGDTIYDIEAKYNREPADQHWTKADGENIVVPDVKKITVKIDEVAKPLEKTTELSYEKDYDYYDDGGEAAAKQLVGQYLSSFQYKFHYFVGALKLKRDILPPKQIYNDLRDLRDAVVILNSRVNKLIGSKDVEKQTLLTELIDSFKEINIEDQPTTNQGPELERKRCLGFEPFL